MVGGLWSVVGGWSVGGGFVLRQVSEVKYWIITFQVSGSSIKSQVLDLTTLPIFSPLKLSLKDARVQIHDGS